MTPERWQQVKAVLDAALEREPQERAAFINKACEGDESLRKELESLIVSDEQAGSFIEEPAVESLAEIITDKGESLVGRALGSYQVKDLLGAGGMGEVYLAEDTRLGRRIALKVLPAHLSGDKDRLLRFQQEARAASSLNHPNILTIYEVGEANDRPFIATEFIEGETLRQRLTQGRPELTEALDISRQVASALSAAHAAGIVHRDIKPENIMIRRDGFVKVLDFGLVKLTEKRATDSEASTLVNTAAGVVMGTSYYMSPEQARGMEVDARTDIWSLGVVLYEMVAGQAPFEGGTPSDVLSLILQRDPAPLVHYSPEVPTELERIIRKALHKDLEERYQTAKDFFIDLKNLRRELQFKAELERSAAPNRSDEVVAANSRGQAAAGTAKQAAVQTNQVDEARPTSSAEYIVAEIKHHKRGVAVALVLVVLAATAVVFWSMRQPQPLGAPVLTQLTTDTGLTTDPALSPDGKMLAYASDRGGKGDLDIWVRQIGGGDPIRLTQDPADEREPTFSPDGTMIAFRSEREGGGIYVVSPLGGSPPRKIASEGQRPRFSPDGSQIAYWAAPLGANPSLIARGVCRIFVVASTGGVPRQLRPDFLAALDPEWTPDGKHIMFLGNRDEKLPVDESIDWWVTPLDQGPAIATSALRATRKEGLTGSFGYSSALISPLWQAGSDSLIFSAHSGDSNNLWRIGISPKTWKVIGSPQRLTYSPALEERPSVASTVDGSLRIAFASLTKNPDLWSLPLDPNNGKVTGEPHQLTRDSSLDRDPKLSPDGRKMVFTSARSGNKQIWIKDFDTGQEVALTADSLNKGCANFSPDGVKVSFAAQHEDKLDIYLVPAAGGPAEMICEDCGAGFGWSPDGKYLLANRADGRLMLVEVTSHRRIDLLGLSGRWFCCGFFSPDGRWITFFEESNPEITHIVPFQGETPAPESDWVSVLAALSKWSPDGTMVYGTSGQDGFSCIWAQRLDRATKRPIGAPFAILHEHGARLVVLDEVSVGRDKMVFEMAERTGNIWMAQWKGGG